MMPELGSKSVFRTDLTEADDLESREGGDTRGANSYTKYNF